MPTDAEKVSDAINAALTNAGIDVSTDVASQAAQHALDALKPPTSRGAAGRREAERRFGANT